VIGTEPIAQRRSTRRWIVCADDFAIDSGAVDGIVDLIARGHITATSALVGSPLWRAAAGMLPTGVGRSAGMAPRRADIGLHLNLTHAFAAQATAVWPLGELILRCALGAISRAALRAAIEHQLDAFENEMGRRPDYVDGHQHVHQFAVVREELIAALLRRYPSDPPWLRSTRPPSTVRDFKARGIAALGDRRLRDLAAAAHLRTSAYLVGVYDFRADRESYWHRLSHWVRGGPDGTVLMCHPSLRTEHGDAIAAARAMEYAALGSEDFRTVLANADIALTTGGALLTESSLPATNAA